MHITNSLLFIVGIILSPCVLLASEGKYTQDDPIELFQIKYDEFVKKYWRSAIEINGITTTVFDYETMSQDAKHNDTLIDKLTNILRSVDTTSSDDPELIKAFWINVYNFSAMKMIVEYYPVDSITSFKISLIKHPWSKRAVQIGKSVYSLSEIEKDILLNRYNDPRVIFAVNCAAISCPDRTPNAFTKENVEEQLDSIIGNFFTNTGKGFFLDRNKKTVMLSWILKKEAHLFEGKHGSVLEFVLPYIAPRQRQWLKSNAIKLNYFDHDWTLNDLAQASHR